MQRLAAMDKMSARYLRALSCLMRRECNVANKMLVCQSEVLSVSKYALTWLPLTNLP